MNNSTRNIVAIIVVAILAFVAYAVLNAPDRRSPTEKIGDAIHDLPQGVDKAGRQLEDRTLGDKINDKIKDSTEVR